MEERGRQEGRSETDGEVRRRNTPEGGLKIYNEMCTTGMLNERLTLSWGESTAEG